MAQENIIPNEMNTKHSITLYTLRNSEGKFIHYHPVGHYWADTPNYVNATEDKDEAHGWAFKKNRNTCNPEQPHPVKVAELTISWNEH